MTIHFLLRLAGSVIIGDPCSIQKDGSEVCKSPTNELNSRIRKNIISQFRRNLNKMILHKSLKSSKLNHLRISSNAGILVRG